MGLSYFLVPINSCSGSAISIPHLAILPHVSQSLVLMFELLCFCQNFPYKPYNGFYTTINFHPMILHKQNFRFWYGSSPKSQSHAETFNVSSTCFMIELNTLNLKFCMDSCNNLLYTSLFI